MNRVLLTGGNGFVGDILRRHLAAQSIDLLGRNPNNDIVCDLTKSIRPIPGLYHFVIHAVGKAHSYPKTPAEKVAFFAVNEKGTANLLQALSPDKVGRFVYISTVAVYGLAAGAFITEDTPVQSNTTYGESKWRGEQLIIDWCNRHNIPYLILRLPLVAGPNPKGNLQKMIQAIDKGKYLRIAKGDAQKSIVWGADIAHLIGQWSQRNNPPSGIYHLTDGVHPTFYQLEEAIRIALEKGKLTTLPLWMATMAGRLGDYLPGLPVNSSTIQKITQSFTFSDAKAREELGWSSTPVLSKIDELVSG